MKVIIPVAGIGSKLRPHTYTQPKTLVPIAGKPILSHIVDALIQSGVKSFVFVLGYLGEKIETYISQRYPEHDMQFVYQEPRKGSAHAIWVCRELIKTEQQIMIVLGDTIANLDLNALIHSPYTVLGLKKVANPLLFGIAEMGEDGLIKKLIEKPKIPKSNLALVGIYKINHVKLLLESIQYIMEHDIKTNNEYHLTDALMEMINRGEKITSIQVDNWFDCGRKDTLLEANGILLNREKFKENLPSFPQTIIIPPVSIGENCKIQDSIIGPNVAIGENTLIKGAIISNTIIGSFSELKNIVLKDSIIGNDTSITGMIQSLNIGDSTEINFEK